MFKRSYPLFLAFGIMALCLILFLQMSCSDDKSDPPLIIIPEPSSSSFFVPDASHPNYNITLSWNIASNSIGTINIGVNVTGTTVASVTIDSVIVYMQYENDNNVATIETAKPEEKNYSLSNKTLNLSNCDTYQNGDYTIYVLVYKKNENDEYALVGTKKVTSRKNNPNCMTYRLKVNIEPPNGGTVSPSSGSSYAPGTNVTLTQNASSGYKFIGWKDEINEYNRTKLTLPITFSTNDREITARFAENKNLVDILGGQRTIIAVNEGFNFGNPDNRINGCSNSTKCDVYFPTYTTFGTTNDATIIDEFEIANGEYIKPGEITIYTPSYENISSYTTDLFITVDGTPHSGFGIGKYYVVRTIGYDANSANKWSKWFLVYAQSTGNNAIVKAWKVQ